jgi:hypothetical protein
MKSSSALRVRAAVESRNVYRRDLDPGSNGVHGNGGCDEKVEAEAEGKKPKLSTRFLLLNLNLIPSPSLLLDVAHRL